MPDMQTDTYVSTVFNWLKRPANKSEPEPELFLVYGEAECGKSTVVSLACEKVAGEFGQCMAWRNLHGCHSVPDIEAAMGRDIFPSRREKYVLVLDGVEPDVLLDVANERRKLMGCHGGCLRVVITSTYTGGDHQVVITITGDDPRVVITGPSTGNNARNSALHGLKIERLRELEDAKKLLQRKDLPVPEDGILRACEGSPLAISILGGLLSDLTRQQLADCLQGRLTQGRGSLQTELLLNIGYGQLADDVKRCFLHTCVMFPLNDVLSKTKLARLCLAEGLVADQNRAEQWIRQLVQRKLLESAGGVRGGGEDTDVLVLRPMRNFAIRQASSFYYTNEYKGHDIVISESQVERASMMLEGANATLSSITTRFKNLKILHVWGAKNWKRPLPPPNADQDPLSVLSRLRKLVHLLLSAAYKGTTINSLKRDSFPLLERLHIVHFPNLTTWKRIQEGAMPNLRSLTLEQCPGMGHHRRPEGLRDNVDLIWD